MILVDTDILSALAKIDRLNLLFELFGVTRLQIVPSVLGEIQINIQEGRNFAQKILDLIANGQLEVVDLPERATVSKHIVPNNFGIGERDSVLIAQENNALLLSNESRVEHFCREKGIAYASLSSILRSLRINRFLSIDELRQVVADLETKDRMKFNIQTIETIFEN